MVLEYMDFVSTHDPELGAAIRSEYQRQCDNIELIASENIVSEAVLAAMGSVLTNKYAEGYPGKRYYGGCQCVDVAENLAIRLIRLYSGPVSCSGPGSPTSSPTPARRPTTPSIWPCASRGTRCWA